MNRRIASPAFAGVVLLTLLWLSSHSGRETLTTNRQESAESPSAEQRVKSAAYLSGYVSGMVVVCGFDSRPIEKAYKAFLVRHPLPPEENQAMLNAIATGMGTGMKTQKAPGSMPCSRVQEEMLKNVDLLRDAP